MPSGESKEIIARCVKKFLVLEVITTSYDHTRLNEA